jgi:hypothetical protein
MWRRVMTKKKKNKIKKIRIWRLGSLEHRIVPTPKAMNRLTKILQDKLPANPEVLDIVWGPELTIEEITLE